jgi:thioesterase domain-containing protein/acyl carrier protein
MAALSQNPGSLANVGEAPGLLTDMVSNVRPITGNELEEVLTAWWQELLGLEHVAVDDDFFDLGGHSLTGVALFAKIKQRYGVELELSTLFEARTVVQLARIISSNLEASRVCTMSPPTNNELEEVLKAWWQELLGLEHVAVDDDFFDLGGHSLTGVALFAKIKQTYGIELELSTLFEARTVVQLARIISCSLETDRVSNDRPPVNNELEEVLKAWWRELLGLEHVAVDDDFFDLGGHSLTGVALFAKIKQTYGIELELSTLFEARTVVQLARVICCNLDAVRNRAKTWQSITPIQPNGSRVPLFWVPGGYGTSLLSFREVSLLLGPDQPVYGFHAAMPDANEEMESIPDRAERFVKELRLFQPHGPYYIVGFCSGGFVAFEMAQQLMTSGQTVGLLGIIECYDDRHPRTWPRKAQFRIERTIWRAGRVLGLGPKGFVQWALGHVASLARPAMRASAKLLGKSVAPLPPEEVDIHEKAHRAIRRYNPVDYPGKSVVLIGGETYHFAGLSRSVDPRLIWCQLSKGGTDIKTIPGDHMAMLEPPIVYRLADALKPYLTDLPVGSLPPDQRS